MLPQFINREAELKFLEKHYRSNKPELIVIYGRRRIGKTELIKEFTKNKNAAYVLTTKDTVKENISLFKDKFAILLKKESFRDFNITNFIQLFERLAEYNGKKRIVVAIDEFSFLIELNRATPSIFQKIWDEILAKQNIMLILCGSSVSMMETEVLGYKSPLYGRRTGQWKLTEFSIKETIQIFPHYNIEDAVKTHFVVGGIPAYLLKFDGKKGIFENIKNSILEKGEFLYEEPEFLLRQEFREQWIYALILKKISLGYHSLSKLYAATGLDKSNLSKYLYVLERVGIIRHLLPLGKRKGGIYVIIDNYFDFWFRFVYKNKTDLESGNVDSVLLKIKNDFNHYCGKRFEYLIENILNSSHIGLPFKPTKLTNWWHKDKEIDLVALNEEKKQILFAECKWQNDVNAAKVFEELKEKAKYVDWSNNNRNEYFAVFAKSFKKKIKQKNLFLFDLKDIEKAC